MAAAIGVLASVLVLSGASGCGGGGQGSSGFVGNGADGGADPSLLPDGGHRPPSLLAELPQPAISVQGGAAPSSAGQGQPGGALHLISAGALALDPAQAAPAAPDTAGASAQAPALDASRLSADVTVQGTARVDGTVETGGGEAARQITINGGDLIIAGTLRAGAVGAARQGLTLNVPSGTVYITGTVDASGAAGDVNGQAGGAVSISALRVVMVGALATSGGRGRAGAGAAGAITISAAQGIVLAGSTDALGGDADGDAVAIGGAGGSVTMQSAAAVELTGALRLRGGGAATTGAEAHGGAGGTLRVDGGGSLALAGRLDARGGPARAASAGGTVTGGAAGSVLVGEVAAPSAIAVLVPLVATGGEGGASGGAGGAVTLQPHAGDLVIAGEVQVGGGDASITPGPGGVLVGESGPSSGGIRLSGAIAGKGGSLAAGASGDGGEGARLTLEVKSETGSLLIDPSGQATLDGGDSGGAGRAGAGGHLALLTRDGDLTMGGQLLLRGGTARDAGGTGGLGGAADIFSDNNHNGMGGHLLITPQGLVDASGGPGTIGGSGRNNGGGGVASFPDNQEQIAILVNCDGRHGITWNWLDNQGLLVARGAAGNGDGGDIAYHGIAPDGNQSPPSGPIDIAADGTGKPGDFRGE